MLQASSSDFNGSDVTAADLVKQADELIGQANQTNAGPGSSLLGGFVLLFVLIVMALMTYLIKKGRGGESVLRAFGVPLIIGSAVFFGSGWLF
jgi:hypothetical protein